MLVLSMSFQNQIQFAFIWWHRFYISDIYSCLSNLQSVKLQENLLRTLPESVSQLSKLERMNLGVIEITILVSCHCYSGLAWIANHQITIVMFTSSFVINRNLLAVCQPWRNFQITISWLVSWQSSLHSQRTGWLQQTARPRRVRQPVKASKK